MDQVAANAEGLWARNPVALVGAVAGGRRHTVYGVATCDGGFSCAYLNNSWANQTTPMPARDEPAHRLRAAVRRRGKHEHRGEAGARAARQRSILDAVMDKVARLEEGLAPYDRRKLDEYLEAVRGSSGACNWRSSRRTGSCRT
ncbi:hypothetical protein GBAR_LOCUS21300 [Geodia barretti]|uniref:Uncharacterized protein n=1 Tax=Geodia barretti TaxID=519541 RepID=A0AA35SYZ9_GEOBA|nr:hypothetical protein GBAR_LOCUS21300 [Geodia barretti]